MILATSPKLWKPSCGILHKDPSTYLANLAPIFRVFPANLRSFQSQYRKNDGVNGHFFLVWIEHGKIGQA